MHVSFKQVYLVVHDHDNRNSVAIRPEISEKQIDLKNRCEVIEWNDINLPVTHKIKSLKTSPPLTPDCEGKEISAQQIIIETLNGKKFTLIKLTLELYQQKIMKKGSPNFKSDVEVQNYFLNENFDY